MMVFFFCLVYTFTFISFVGAEKQQQIIKMKIHISPLDENFLLINYLMINLKMMFKTDSRLVTTTTLIVKAC